MYKLIWYKGTYQEELIRGSKALCLWKQGKVQRKEIYRGGRFAIHSVDQSKALANAVVTRALAVARGGERNVCDVCGSDDIIEAPHMGRNCNTCHPIFK